MKKLKLMATSLLMGVLLFALASCGGAKGTVSSFVGAVKKLDFEKAATYCLDEDLVKAGDEDNDMEEIASLINADEDKLEDFIEYVSRQSVANFKYKVESTEENEDGTQVTLKISYSNIDNISLMTKFGVDLGVELGTSILTGGKVDLEVAKDKFDAELKVAKEDIKEGTATVVLRKNDDGEWKLVSGVALITVMITGNFVG